MLKPEKLHQRVAEVIGEYHIIKSYREGSTRTNVWEVKGKATLDRYFVKSFTRRSRWGPEVYAYQNWIPAIEPYAPKLISSIEEEDLYAIITSSLGNGVTLLEVAKNLTEEQHINAYYKAGEVTRKLHSVVAGTYFGRPDNEGNPIEIFHHQDPVYYLQQSIIKDMNKGKEIGCLGARELELGEWAIQQTHLFRDSKPRAISWDSTPNNWIVDEKTGEFLGLIDFENMMWGFEVDHFTMMEERYFPDFPKGKEAFYKGYGYDFLGEKEIELKVACIKKGIGSLVWSTVFNDERSIKLAKQLLESINI